MESTNAPQAVDEFEMHLHALIITQQCDIIPMHQAIWPCEFLAYAAGSQEICAYKMMDVQLHNWCLILPVFVGILMTPHNMTCHGRRDDIVMTNKQDDGW